MERYTNADLAAIIDDEDEAATLSFILSIVRDRKNKLGNPYTPLYKALAHAEGYLENERNNA